MNSKKIISIGSDHGGFVLKETLRTILTDKGFTCIDEGCYSPESVDYPDIAKKVCDDVVANKCDFGVLICTSGIGMSMTANKIKGIRAALCLSDDSAKFSRLHNNANVICIGAKYSDAKLSETMIDIFANTEFEGGRHQRRVQKMMDMQND